MEGAERPQARAPHGHDRPGVLARDGRGRRADAAHRGRVLPRDRDRRCAAPSTPGSTCAPTWWSSRSSTIPKAIRGGGFGIRRSRRRRLPTRRTTSSATSTSTSSGPTRTSRRSSYAGSSPRRGRRRPRREAMAHEIFDGILNVRMQGLAPAFAPWDCDRQWRGAENVLLDLADRPEFMHRIIRAPDRCVSRPARPAEEQGLLVRGQSRIHCTGAYTDELPGCRVRPRAAPGEETCGRSAWPRSSRRSPRPCTRSSSSTTPCAGIERFGLVYYGCCEPLHTKIDLVRSIPHVRKISMSPWVERREGRRAHRAATLSSRASPARRSWPATPGTPEGVARDLRDTLERAPATAARSSSS